MPNVITAGNSSNGGTAISTDTSGALNIVTGSGSGSNAITIDASQNISLTGNVGVGTTSTSGYKFAVGGSGLKNQFIATDANNAYLYTDGSAYIGSTGAFNCAFITNNAERMRIDSSGNLLIGTSTATGKLTINGANSWTTGVTFAGAAANTIWQTGFTSQALSTSLQATGSIIGNGVYSVSDSRMKENIVDIENGMDFVNNVNPVQFDWKELKTKDTGFIAQDLLAKGYSHLVSAIPDATMQEVIESDGNVSPEGLRLVVKYESIVPILCKAIQELKAELDALKAKVGE
jgi:hypothetical protein